MSDPDLTSGDREWRRADGNPVGPHRYWPDYQAMGDCIHCGQVKDSSAHVPINERGWKHPMDPRY